MTTDELLKLARFQMLDSRNCNEAARIRLLGQMADELERYIAKPPHKSGCPVGSSDPTDCICEHLP